MPDSQLTGGRGRARLEMESENEFFANQRLLSMLSEDARVRVFEGVGYMS
jgi:hypothetical protein